MRSVQSRQRLHGPDACKPLVHEQRVEQRLVETRLVLFRHEQHPVFLRRELFGQSLLADTVVHLHFVVLDTRMPVVPNRAGERDERPDRVALFLDIAVEALLVAYGFETRAGDDHGLGTSADLVPGRGLEVLHHDLGLLRDVVRMQAQESGACAAFLRSTFGSSSHAFSSP